MKKTLIIASLILLLFVSCNAQKAKLQTEKEILNKSELEPKIDELVKQYQNLDIFSGVVLLAEKGKIIYHKAFGLANREKNISNTLDTKFDIGSMNKTFTKIVVLQLAEEGKLNLNDNLGKYLDKFSKEASQKITINHLLNHESGLGDYHSPDFFDSPKSEKTITGLLPRIEKMELLFEPGTGNEYSNAGYILLGAIIEKATGKSYHQNVRERIIVPLELNETYIDKIDKVTNRAIGYFKDAKGNLNTNEGFMEIPNPDGGFQSTTLDIMKFYNNYFYGNKLLSKKAKKLSRMHKRQNANWENGEAIMHAGGFEGANTALYEILRDQISIIVFANMNEPVAENLADGILSIIRGENPKHPALPAIQNVYKAFNEKGINYLRNNFNELTTNFHPSDPKDLILNQLGYDLLFDGKVEESISVFKLNTELFPEVANCWDSYGESLLEAGNKNESLKAYRKALSINPDLPSAQQKVKELTVD